MAKDRHWIRAVLRSLLYIVALHTRDRASRIAALIICLVLVVIGGMWFPSERISTPALGNMKPTLPMVGFIESGLARHSASPLWYRGGRLGLLSISLLIWLWGWFRLKRK